MRPADPRESQGTTGTRPEPEHPSFTATAEQLAPGYATEEPDPNDDPDPGNADH